MDSEIIIENEKHSERSTKPASILRSIENKNVETVPSASKKKIKRVSSVHNGYLILSLGHFYESTN